MSSYSHLYNIENSQVVGDYHEEPSRRERDPDAECDRLREVERENERRENRGLGI